MGGRAVRSIGCRPGMLENWQGKTKLRSGQMEVIDVKVRAVKHPTGRKGNTKLI